MTASLNEDWDILKSLLADLTDKELSIFELEQLLVKFGIANAEKVAELVNSDQPLSEIEREKLIISMDSIPDDDFSEEDSIRIGREINKGIARRYHEWKKGG